MGVHAQEGNIVQVKGKVTNFNKQFGVCVVRIDGKQLIVQRPLKRLPNGKLPLRPLPRLKVLRDGKLIGHLVVKKIMDQQALCNLERGAGNWFPVIGDDVIFDKIIPNATPVNPINPPDKPPQKQAVKVPELEELAELGVPRYQYLLGLKLFKEGKKKEAIKWFHSSAEQGDDGAQYELARAYRFAVGGLDKNMKQAAYWFGESAEQGNDKAQYELGYIYQNGADGIPMDLVRAYSLMTQAADSGLRKAVNERTDLGALLDPNQLNDAEKNVADSYEIIGKKHRFNDQILKARRFFQKSLAIRRKLKIHSGEMECYNNLGELCLDTGDYENARIHFQRSLDVVKRKGLEGHAGFVKSLNNMGTAFHKMGESELAMKAYLRALDFGEANLGLDDIQLAEIHFNLGELNREIARYEVALKHYKSSLQFFARQVDVALASSGQAVSRFGLGQVQLARGDFNNAIKTIQSALVLRKNTGKIPAKFEASCHRELAFAYYFLGDNIGVENSVKKVLELERKRLEDILSFASERERLAYQRSFDPFSLIGTLGGARYAADLADDVLRYKGIVLTSLLEDQVNAQADSDPAVRALVDQFKVASRKLYELRLENKPKEMIDAAQAMVDRLQQKMININLDNEAILARKSLSLDHKDVQAKLPVDSVLLEYIQYYHHQRNGTRQVHYGVVVIGKLGNPQWIPLGTAEKVDALINQYQVETSKKHGMTDKEYEPILRSLHDTLVGPVVRTLPAGSKTLIFSPDGRLNFLSFATLLTKKDQFLCEDYTIKYVSSGRDIVLGSRADKGKREIHVFALSNFDDVPLPIGGANEVAANLRAGNGANLGVLSKFKILNSTNDEADFIKDNAKEWKLEPRILTNRNATEAAINNIQAPRILHLATHGFVLSGEKKKKNPALMPLNSNNATVDVKPGTILWEFETGGVVESSPAIGKDGTVYIGSNDRKLYALYGNNGTKKWEFMAEGVFESTPAIGPDGTVYIGCRDEKVYALNGETGASKWEYPTGDVVLSSPAVDANGTIYIGSEDGNLHAIDSKFGTMKWIFKTGGGVFSSPAIGVDGTVYFGSKDHKVYALDGKTGAKKWEFETGNPVQSSPAIGQDGIVYIGSNDGSIYALYGNNGTKKWDIATSGEVTSSPAIWSSQQGSQVKAKQLNIQFTAIDGRKVDLAKMKGKVVLVYFWGYSNLYNSREINEIKRVYENLRQKGFEIIGIHDGADENIFKNFIRVNKIPWPQYNAGKGVKNKFSNRFYFTGRGAELPKWLIDKEGNLVDTTVNKSTLSWKVEKLLAGKRLDVRATAVGHRNIALFREIAFIKTFDKNGNGQLEEFERPDEQIKRNFDAEWNRKNLIRLGNGDTGNQSAGGTLYVGSGRSPNGKLNALDTETGALIWQFPTTLGSVWSSPAIGAHGTVYFGARDSMVHALDGRLGIAKWNFKTGDAVWSSPAIGNNGNLYIGSNDNKIYKIAGNSHGPANSPWAMYGRSAQRTGADRNLAKIVPPKKPRALTKNLRNPMHLSGLALAGANKTVEAWNNGQAPPTDNDGILTAAEASTLNLKGTWLVTLSACATGRGEARSGEGVLGLRRAFIQAGTQNLLMTLWNVEDRFAEKFMRKFYPRAVTNDDAATTLADVQKEMLKNMRGNQALKAAGRPTTRYAVWLYGPFIMSFQGVE